MRLKKERIVIEKMISNIYVFDKIGMEEKPEDFNRMIEEDQEIGFAGFSKREYLNNLLEFYNVKGTDKPWVKLDDITRIVTKTLRKCTTIVPLEEITVFVFPTVSEFIMEKMNGIAGDCFWKNTMLLFIHPDSKMDNLPRIVAHEYAHAYSLNHLKRETLRDKIVFDGIAEHFSMSVIVGKKSFWVDSVNRNESLRIYDKLREKMSSCDNNLYSEVFFGTGKYPLWAGYSIGYNLVSDYMKKLEKIEWIVLLRTEHHEIVSKSGW